MLHSYHGLYWLLRQTAENDWDLRNRRGKRDIVNIERLKPYVAREVADDVLVDTTDPPTTPRDQPAPTQKMGLDTNNDEEFFDAVESFPGVQPVPKIVANSDKDSGEPPHASDTSRQPSGGSDHLRRVPAPRRDDGFLYY